MSYQQQGQICWFKDDNKPSIDHKSTYIHKMSSRRWLSRQYKVKDTVVVGVSAVFCMMVLYFTYLALKSESQPDAPRVVVEAPQGRYWGSRDWVIAKSPTGGQWTQCRQESTQVSQEQLDETVCDNTDTLMSNMENTEPVHQPVFTPGLGSNYSNLLELPCPSYLKNYRNPCWKEYVDSPRPYENNLYWKLEDQYFNMAQERWAERWSHGQNWRLRCLPHFFLVGPPKTGTTDLFSKLINHPEIRVAARKEPNWWTITRFKEDGLVSLTQYIDLYDVAAQRIYESGRPEPGCSNIYHPGIVGDFSTWTFGTSFDWQHLPENKLSPDGPRYTTAHYVRHLIPRAKIIFILRNPVDRLYSAYNFYDMGTKTPQAFHEWVVAYIEIFNACLRQEEIRACTYKMLGKQLTTGMYFIFIQDWLSVFPREQMHFIHLEKDYSPKPIEALEGLLEFLGVGPIPQLTLSKMEFDSRKNAVPYPAMLAETRELLSEFYSPFNERLAQLLGDNRYKWGPDTEVGDTETFV